MIHQPYNPYNLKCAITAFALLFISVCALAQGAVIRRAIPKDSISAKTKFFFHHDHNGNIEFFYKDSAWVILPDADDDGVPDQFDIEPDTPYGVKVDIHGRALSPFYDSAEVRPAVGKPRDMDTVIRWFMNKTGAQQHSIKVKTSYGDSEEVVFLGLLPEYLKAVTLNSVHKRNNIKALINALSDYLIDSGDSPCPLTSLPPIYFDGLSTKLNKKAKAALDSVAALLAANPACAVAPRLWSEEGLAGSRNQKYNLIEWDRVNTIISYLVKTKKISEERIVGPAFDDSLNPVRLKPVSLSEWPKISSVPAPFPHYRNQTLQGQLKATTSTLPDSDGDGIPDQLDLEPNTPKGAEVDTHGRVIDTDGDGVPDYKDKQKLTSQACFPVDSNGVGVCPEPECCRGLKDKGMIDPAPQCFLTKLPSIQFEKGSAELSKTAMATLDSVVQLLFANPDCNVIVKSYYGVFSYFNEQLSWDRTFNTVKYLTDSKGVLSSHIIFSCYNEGGLPGVVELITTANNGSNMEPSPHRAPQ